MKPSQIATGTGSVKEYLCEFIPVKYYSYVRFDIIQDNAPFSDVSWLKLPDHTRHRLTVPPADFPEMIQYMLLCKVLLSGLVWIGIFFLLVVKWDASHQVLFSVPE